MECSRCGHTSPDGANFCGECGAGLATPAGCPACGHENPPGQRFCNECGAPQAADAASALPVPRRRDPRDYTPAHLADKILTGKAALEGERKQVSVLFVDVKGSMDLAREMDDEDWHRILDRFFAILTDGVHRFEGTVNQYTGDGIMALFGAPIAHEDHAQRACWTALHLREELRAHADELRVGQGLDFSVRMGINSGEVVVGKIGDDLRMDYTAQGHTVGLAARMEQIAAANSVYVSEATQKIVGGYFELRDLGETPVKGSDVPIHVYELQGAGTLRTRLDVSRARGLSRFVGRADERAILDAALERAIEGSGGVIGVVADAGAGKSRLCYEFAEGARAKGVTVREVQCVAHGKQLSFLPVLQLLRGVFGIADTDDGATSRQKIAGALLLLDSSLEEALPSLFHLMGVTDPARPAPPMDPDQRQAEFTRAVRRYMQARSETAVGVTIIEDLHWIDTASDSFLAQMVEAAQSTRTLLIVNFRPEYRADWMQKSFYQQIPLRPLGPEEIAELCRDLLGTHESVAGLAGRIAERTAGNPFFVEEVVVSLAESGALEGARGAYRLVHPVEQIDVPGSVQSVLAARIDRLAEREKQLLQTAAVIGKTFAAPVLERVSDLPEAEIGDALRALQSAEFIYEESLYPQLEYAFKHPLTQEVAYRSQLSDRRQHIHAAVARAIEALEPEKARERAALLAHHYEEAGEAYEAAGRYAKAADDVWTNDPAQACAHCDKVVALLAHDDSPQARELRLDAINMMLGHGGRVGIAAERLDALFGEGAELAERSGSAIELPRLLVNRVQISVYQGRIRDALETSREALQRADALGIPPLQLAARFAAGMVYMLAGPMSEAHRVFDEALELSDAHSVGIDAVFGSPQVVMRWMRGATRAFMGRFPEARADLERALEMAIHQDDKASRYASLSWLATTDAYTGDNERGERLARQAVQLSEEVGSYSGMTISRRALGHTLLGLGRPAEAAEAFAYNCKQIEERNVALLMWPQSLAGLAEAQAEDGRFAEALETADRAIAAGEETGIALSGVEARLARAKALCGLRGVEARTECEAELAAAERIAQEVNFFSSLLGLYETRARVAEQFGDDAARIAALREAQRISLEFGATTRADCLAQELRRSS